MIDILEAMEGGNGVPNIDVEEDIIAGMMLQFILIFIVLTIALFINVRFVTKRLWRPFDETLEKAERFNLAQSEVPVFDDTGIQEFDRLNATLTQLMKKDKETYRIQKEFTENASHELQTPLAIMRSKLDLLIQENLGEKEMRLVSDLCHLTMRMGHLNNNLLLLAKIENAQYAALQEQDLMAVLSESLPLYEALQEKPAILVEDMRTDRQTRLQANPVLLECLLKNLVVNAIRHSPPGKPVRICLDDGCLSVANEAVDCRPLNASTLFMRFHSGSTSQKKGNGLGLAIVKAICDFHGWTVDYHFEASEQHVFIVRFDAARP